MRKHVLISGASFAGLTLAYWLNKSGFKVTVVELGGDLRTAGSPIDVRGDALDIARKMGIYDQIKANEFIHTDEIVGSEDQTLAKFAINTLPEYLGDIEIHRGDLVKILYEAIPKDEVAIIFGNSISDLRQGDNHVEVKFENGESEVYDLVFGADGTHSIVRKLVFGPEEDFKKFLGVYFAFAAADHIQTGRPKSTGIVYRELGKQAVIFQFKEAANAILVFRAPKLDWNYRDREQPKQILKDHFGGNTNWKIPQILDAMVDADDLYFDEACQIKMPTWTKGRVALIGDAAYAPSFFTGMGTSLAMQGAALLAEQLQATDDHQTAFIKYNEVFKPFVDSIHARVDDSLKVQLPETEEELKASIKAWTNDNQ
ncbi:FAD-dependent monooxygenase [Chitinophaga pinensis]|uniref:Monooxygenase FAD-binding n=1 Tax=Chitinophaga pinensis (strain ATCC 43595 / DSM 2588 / LMG 13176 / NBRC 15968 / NCIMB 11800 / UQM 2034) TaxID=485918 RepID=A0A979GQN6_CHIPD|nr:FAD-dependent monooxygenase [Chitinophaga pinensis]ACU61702.1 monooxygenase FAD-binding [Chitinophaga pinensis DSM 2588]